MALLTRALPDDLETQRTASEEAVAPTASSWRPSTNAVALAAFLAVSVAIAAFGSSFADTGAGSWYRGLHRPSYAPPAWAFDVGWIATGVLTAYAGWRVWRRIGPEPDRRRALRVFAIQVLVGALWLPVYFGAQAPDAALLVAAAAWLAVFGVLLTFGPVDPLAAVLLVPPFAWVSYVAVLNAAIVLMT